MRARLAIAANGRQVKLREVVLRDKPAEMLAISPKGTVPVLQLEDGTVIEQSLEIMQWAYGSPLTSPLVERNDGEFKGALDRYKYFERHPEHPQSHSRAQGEVFLASLEESLHPNLSGDEMGFTDFAIVPFVRQFAGVDEEWFAAAPYPKVRNWLRRFVASELYATVMLKYPQWKQGDEEPIFRDDNDG